MSLLNNTFVVLVLLVFYKRMLKNEIQLLKN